MYKLFTYFIILLLIKIFTPTIKGWVGERIVQSRLRSLPEEYVLLNDIMLRKDTGTTQIDHILLSPYGIFVIETKNYSGWIFGNEYQKQWTKTMYGKKYKFYNPVMQNYGHVKTIEAVTHAKEENIIPIVAFTGSCTLKNKSKYKSHVIYSKQLKRTILTYTNKVITPTELKSYEQILTTLNITDPKVRRQHVKDIKQKHK